MKRTLFSILLFFQIFLAAAAPEPGSVEQKYQAARGAWQSLRADEDKRVYRDKWEALIARLEQLLSARPAPDKDLEARIRFTLASSWEDLYRQSHRRSDLVRAREEWGKLAARCPESNLADDALYRQAQLSLKLEEPALARSPLLLILQSYAEGDQIDQAQFALEELGRKLGPTPGKESGKEVKASDKAAKAGERPEDRSDSGKGAKADRPDEKARAVEKAEDKRGESGKLEEKPPVELTAVKVWTNPDYTRLVLTFSDRPSYRYHLKDAASKQGSPGTLWVDLTGVKPSEAFRKTLSAKDEQQLVPVSGGLLEEVTLQRMPEEVLRVNVSVDRVRDYRVTLYANPFRLLVDIFGHVETGDDGAEDALGSLVKALPPEKQGKGKSAPRWVIVIDPGHGGDDPGAVGPTGKKEKDVVLAIGKKLRRRLQTIPGVQVIMTRETDVFVSLDERTRQANLAHADLFLSIHANASPNATRSGLETYYLDTASDEAAEKLAAAENASLGKQDGLDFILQDLVVEGNVTYSRHLAQTVHASLLAALKKGYPPASVKDLGVRSALFYVLFGAQMPSILLEVSFISHKVEESRLASEIFQNLAAEAIRAGVKKYLDEAKTQKGKGGK